MFCQNHHTDTVEERIHRTALGRHKQKTGFFFKYFEFKFICRELQNKDYATECLEGICIKVRGFS